MNGNNLGHFMARVVARYRKIEIKPVTFRKHFTWFSPAGAAPEPGTL
jgi:hypothetical protein